MAKIWLLTRTEEEGRELLDQLISEGHWVTWNRTWNSHSVSWPPNYTEWPVDEGRTHPHDCALTVGFSDEEGHEWMGTDLSKVLTCIE